MNTLRIPEKNFMQTYAATIDELQPDQWLHYVSLIEKVQANAISWDDFEVSFLYNLLNLKPTKKGGADKLMNVTLLRETLRGFYDFSDKDSHKRFIHTETVLNLLPEFEWEGETYKGPGVLLHDITFGEFLQTYQVYGDYCKSENKDALTYMLTILYSNGQPFSIREKALDNLPSHYGLANFFFFRSCVEHLTTKPIVVHGNEIPVYQIFDTKQAAGTRQKVNPLGLETVLFDLGEIGVFGSTQELKQQNLFEVLRYLWNKDRKNEEEKRKANVTSTRT